MNLHALLFQHLRDSMKETREGSRKIRIWIPLGRLVSDILMESKLIDSLIEDQITKGIEPQVSKMFNSKGMKNIRIIPEVISLPDEIPKEDVYNKRVPLEYFLIFSKSDPLDIVIGFLESCHVNSILASSETTSKKKRKVSKKHSERMAKKFKVIRENLDTFAEEPKAFGATSARTTSGKFVPSKAQSFSINSSSIMSTTITSPTPIPHIFEQVHFQTSSSPQTSNPNVTIPPPSTSHP